MKEGMKEGAVSYASQHVSQSVHYKFCGEFYFSNSYSVVIVYQKKYISEEKIYNQSDKTSTTAPNQSAFLRSRFTTITRSIAALVFQWPFSNVYNYSFTTKIHNKNRHKISQAGTCNTQLD